jgi:hypothetical protein
MAKKHFPHALTISCDTGLAIFGCDYTKQAAYFGETSTSCVRIPEDILSTLLDCILHRSGQCNLEEIPPHASNHSECSSAIFKHASYCILTSWRAISAISQDIRKYPVKWWPCLHRSGLQRSCQITPLMLFLHLMMPYSNLRSRLHNASHISWWIISLMCRNIRGCLVHTLWSAMAPKHHNQPGRKSTSSFKIPKNLVSKWTCAHSCVIVAWHIIKPSLWNIRGCSADR